MVSLVRYALRQLRQAPGFAITAMLTLSLGIGASTAVFGVLDAVLLAPLPFAEPDRLVSVATQPDGIVSIPTMQDYQARSTTFASLAAYRSWSPVQKTADTTAAHRILVVSQGFFSTLGTGFALGGPWPRTGNEQECLAQAVVSGAYWHRLGGGVTLGAATLHLDGRDFAVAGVLPVAQAIDGSGALNQPEVFVMLGCDRQARPADRGDRGFSLIGRLRPNVTLAQANADLARVDATLHRDYPSDGSYQSAFARPPVVSPYVELLVGADTRPALLMTLVACGLLLAIACANLANLLLARNTRRRGEFALRATVGASLQQLLQQLVVESVVLVTFGALGGVALALSILQLLRTTTAVHLPRLAHASLRPAVLGFAIALCVLVVVFLTLLPAWRTLRPGLLGDLQGGNRSSAGRGPRLTGRLLVAAQLVFTIVLLACSGWMIGGVSLLLHQPLGFAPDHLVMAQAEVGSEANSKAQRSVAELTLQQMARSLRTLPGVASVAFTDHQPLGHATNRYDFCSDAHPERCRQQVTVHPNSYAISPGYFNTIGQPLLAGRDFTPADDGRRHVAIVNQALAEREWPGQTALGHRVRTGEIEDAQGMSWATVIGVVANVHNYDLVSRPGPDLYIPRSEDPSGAARIVVRVAGDPQLLEHAIRQKLKTQFATVRTHSFSTMTEEMAHEVAQRVFLMQVAIAFGAVALFLAVLGTYGLLAYEISLRGKEIGIRLALGSSRERIVGLMLQEEGRWLGAGIVLGLGCALGTGYLLRARFYGIQATSLPVLFGATLLLLVPALVAIALPATRAALQDPADTLRRE